MKFRQNGRLWVLALAALILALAVGAAAFAEPAQSGTCGKGVTWSVAGGKLTISGSGEMDNYEMFTDQPWFGRTDITALSVESGVTGIGSNAFKGLQSLATVTISEGVQKIGDHAFESCTGLTTLGEFPASIKSFGDYSFQFVPLAEYLTIPSGSIGRGAFESCGTVRVLTLGDKVTAVAADAFNNVPLQKVYYEGTREQWNEVKIESSGNKALTGAPLVCNDGGECGEGVTWSVRDGKLTISGKGRMMDFLTWDHPDFNYAQPWFGRTDITSLEIGSGVTHIGLNAFRAMTGLKSVTIPANVQDVGFAAFCDCSGLTEITVHCRQLGESAFIRCVNLTEVNIGPEVMDIGISAFERCDKLQKVFITDLKAWCKIAFGGLLANPVELGQHLYLNGAELTSMTVPAGITKINDYAFINDVSLVSVVLPEGLEEIGEYAFCMCKNLKNLTLPSASLKRIGGCAFESCTNLALEAFPASIEYYGAYCFRFAPLGAGGNLTIPSGHIGIGAFQNCGTVAFLTLGEKVSYISQDAFKGLPLQQLYYDGSQVQWEALRKESGNEPLTGLTPVCRGGNTTAPGRYTGKKEVTFGRYDGHDITWLVLDHSGDKTLLLSKSILDFMKFDYRSEDKTWATSDIRAWLNGTFLNGLTPEQQSQVVSSQVPSSVNSRYGTTGGPATEDKVFLLSEQEVRKYFPYEETAAARATTGAYNRTDRNPAVFDPNDPNNYHGNTSYWWLRTRGMYPYQAEYVDYLGYVHTEGMTFNNINITGVRPAMWVKTAAVDPDADTGEDPDADPTGFVTRLYNVCMGREPDEAGLAYWVSLLTSGQETGTTAAYGFIFSQEFMNKNYCNEHYVSRLYQAFMGREADEGGLKGWVGNLAAGATREAVFNGFAMSEEFGNICKSYGILKGDPIRDPGRGHGTVQTDVCSVCGVKDSQNDTGDDDQGETDGVTAFVTRLYRVCMNREPDAAGLEGWTKQLREQILTGKDATFGFIFSTEFTSNGYSDEVFVEYLYKAFFGRDADPDGKAGWLAKLAAGLTRENVCNGFVGSAEFINLCASYGIEPGIPDPIPDLPGAESVPDVSGAVFENPEAADVPQPAAPEAEEAVPGTAEANGDEAARAKTEKAQAFVLHCYRAALNREPGMEDINFYAERILSGEKSEKQVAKDFLFSAEFVSRNLSGEETIRVLYRLYFNREPDEAGFSLWLEQLNAGTPLETLAEYFASSGEFQAILENPV